MQQYLDDTMNNYNYSLFDYDCLLNDDTLIKETKENIIEELTKYIHKNIQTVTLKDLYIISGLPKEVLDSGFMTTHGVSVISYINNLRLNELNKMIKELE